MQELAMNIITWLFLGTLIGVLAKSTVLRCQNASWFSIILLSILGALLGGRLHDFAQAANISVLTFGFIVPDIHAAGFGSTIAISFYCLLLYSKL